MGREKARQQVHARKLCRQMSRKVRSHTRAARAHTHLEELLAGRYRGLRQQVRRDRLLLLGMPELCDGACVSTSTDPSSTTTTPAPLPPQDRLSRSFARLISHARPRAD